MSFWKKLFGKVGKRKGQNIRNDTDKKLNVEMEPDMAFVDDCFRMDFQEIYDDRRWETIPEAKAIPQAANTGNIPKALEHASELQAKYPDFFFSYFWMNHLYLRQKRFEEAREVLIKGLSVAKGKSALCDAMGDTEWELGNLMEAVKWWIKSVFICFKTKTFDDPGPFLYLSYIATELGLGKVGVSMTQITDSIRSLSVSLSTNATNKLRSAINSQSGKSLHSLRLAFEQLSREFLKQEQPKPAISQLQCESCSKVINDFHYEFESIDLCKILGCQCSGCGRVLCLEHMENDLSKAQECPHCGRRAYLLMEGPAYSSLVEEAKIEGKYGIHIRPPDANRHIEQE
jgi:tetratricopeptide (TPR) repeat protein